ncbi:hypothetical protein [Helicobacter sp. UBA3407]|uniref:hypothetical protein n=1 Tax=Helicobacter sp. UBA3407 TaxID=1946588 RepID=UPI00262B511A|nr:hypothetical protein [Helicobacter sp. UBA3407]
MSIPPPPAQLVDLQDKILSNLNSPNPSQQSNTSNRNILNALSELPSKANPNSLQIQSVAKASNVPTPRNAPQARAVGGDWDNTSALNYNTATNEVSGNSASGRVSSNGSNKDLTIATGTTAKISRSVIEVKGSSNIQNLTNLGDLQTSLGSSVWVEAGSYVENLTNSGKMQGIEVGGTINNFTIDSNGIIYNDSNAIYAREGKINNLIIKGVIKVERGSAIWTARNTSEIGNIHIDGGKVLSNVTHSTGIINLSNGTTNKITIDNGAIVGVLNPSSSNKDPLSVTINDIDKGGKGIHIEGSQVTGGIQISGSGTYVNGIENGFSGGGNPGLIQGGINIENGATLGQIDNVGASTIAGNITIGNGSTLDKINNIQNSVILGGILYQGNGDLTINSSGIIKGENGTHIENSGSGNVKIENILIGTDNPHNISGNNTSNITFDKITLDTQGKPLPGHINDILTGSFDLNQIKTIVTDAGDIFNFTMDANGNFTTSLDLDNLNATSGAKSIITGNQRISSFANNVATTSLMNLQNAFNHSTTFYDASLRNQVHYANATGALGTDIINQSPNLDSLYFKDRIVYVLPYISSQEVEVGNGTKMSGNVQGIIAGYSKITPFNNLYSFYVGFEGEDTDSQGSSLKTNVISKTLYGGFKMLHYLTNLSEKAELYAQYDASFGLRNNRLKSDSIGTTSSADPRSYFYNAGVDLGVNYLWGKNIITPKIGLGYEGGMIENYNLNIANTKIDRQDLNFLHTRASVLWSRAWNPKLHTYIEGGLKYIFNPDLDLTGSYAVGNNRQKASKEMDLDELNEFINVGIYVPLSNVLTFDVVYSGSFSDNTTGHSGYLKFNYLF